MSDRVYFGKAPATAEAMAEALEWSGVLDGVRRSGGVFVKPNLTFPVYRPGVTTSPEMIERVLAALSGCGRKVYVGESDGGYGSYRIEDAFRNFGLHEMAARHGATVVNLSAEPRVPVPFRLGRREVVVGLPRFLVEGDVELLTMPVPKVHCMTGISLSLKNQWGCIPDTMRLRLHVHFDELIHGINRVLKLRYTVMDGTHGLDVNGPIIEGEAVPLGWFLASASPLAADSVAAHLIGQDLRRISHYRPAIRENRVPDFGSVEVRGGEGVPAAVRPFRLRRNFWNYVAKTAWYSKTWNTLVYESALSKPIHDVMYMFRERPKEFDR